MPASAIFMPQRARRNNMDYFYEHESELFTFYRVPKVLFTEEQFKNINCEAKLLYGLLLDKMGLSRKSGWFDKQGRAFVYYGMRKRPIKISLRLNEQEHEHLKQQAMLSGFTMEVFLRALISGMNLRSRPLAEYAEIRRQLAGIGNNINDRRAHFLRYHRGRI